MNTITKKHGFKKNFSWNFFGNIIYAATQWGLIVAITRLGNVEMVGVYTLALALTSPIMMFTNLDLRTVQVTERNQKTEFSHFVALRFITNSIFIILLFLVFKVAEYSSSYLIVVLIVAISKIIESWSDLAYGIFQKKERMDFLSKSQIIRGSSALFLVSILLISTNSLGYSLIGLTLAWLLSFIFYDLKTLKKFGITFKLSFSRRIISIAKLALPLGIVALIVSLNVNIPRLFVENFLGVEMLGYFATIFYFVMVGEKFVRSISQVALPRLSSYFQQNDLSSFKSLLYKVLLLSFSIGLIGIVVSYFFGEILLIIFYGEEFSGYNTLFVLVMTYGMFNYISSSLLAGLNSLQYFSIQQYLSVIWLITMLFASYFFIQSFGLNGAGLALIIYSIVRLFTILFALMFSMKKTFNK